MTSATARIVLTVYFGFVFYFLLFFFFYVPPNIFCSISLYFRLPMPQMYPFYQQKFLEGPKLRDLKSVEQDITKRMGYLEIPPISPVL